MGPNKGGSLDKLNVSSASITQGQLVGKGRFGDVHQGHLKGKVTKSITQFIGFHSNQFTG